MSRNQWLLFGRNRLFLSHYTLQSNLSSTFSLLFKILKSSNLALKYFSLDLRELFGPFDIVYLSHCNPQVSLFFSSNCNPKGIRNFLSVFHLL